MRPQSLKLFTMSTFVNEVALRHVNVGTVQHTQPPVALADGECPAETGDGPILRIMTIALTLAVNDAVNELWKENADEIKKRCGPSMPKGLIDRQELFAFVLNDVLGRPLLPHDAAREVGQTGDNAVAGAIRTKPPERRGKLLKAQDAAKEAIRSAKRAAAKDASLLPRVAAAEAAGEAAIATVLTATVELKLPNATVVYISSSTSD